MNKIISRVSYFYVAVPFLIFVIGFVRWYISMPIVLITVWGLISMWKDADEFEIKPKTTKDRIILIIAFAVTLLWVILSGIGNVTWQNEDHIWRNALFKILVDYDWPPVNSEGRGLTYYSGFWLPSALVGKVLGLRAGFIFQIVWAAIGVYLVYLYICEYLKRIAILPFIIFVFFSGLDIVGAHIPDLFTHSFSYIPLYTHIETWAGTRVFLYSGITTQLFWVFNQCIYSWLVLMMILKSKTNKHMVFLMGLSFISSVFGFMGLIPIAIYCAFTKKQLFSLQNIVCGGATGILTLLYYIGNDASKSTSSIGLPASIDITTSFPLYLYICFIVLEVLVYVALAFKYNKKDPLFYITAVFLMICPLIKFGGSIDFCMRASIPCLMLLSLYVIDAFYRSRENKDNVLTILITITLLIGSITAVQEIYRTILNTSLNTPRYFGTESNIFDEGNFSCDADDTVFFKYIGY